MIGLFVGSNLVEPVGAIGRGVRLLNSFMVNGIVELVFFSSFCEHESFAFNI